MSYRFSWFVDAVIQQCGFFAPKRHQVSRKEFDTLAEKFSTESMLVRQATEADLDSIFSFAGKHLSLSIAEPDIVLRVMQHNPDSVWLFYRYRVNQPQHLMGALAFLLLTEQGLNALLDNSLPFWDPPLALLTPAGEKPAAIYIWATAATKMGSLGFVEMAKILSQPLYRDVNIYGSTDTKGGVRLSRGIGFTPVSEAKSPRPLMYYCRLVNRPK